jgi:biotin transport system substrate-specific component
MAREEPLKLDSWRSGGAGVGDAAHADAQAAPWRRIAGGVAMLALIAVCAQLAVPLPGTPVPVTLQSLAVMVVGVVLGPVPGALMTAAYVLVGALGAPVFANGGAGPAWLLGPTGGYLLAFPLVAFVIGHAAAPGRAWWLLPIGVAAAQLVMFTGGALQLALVTGRGLSEAVALGVVPFLPGEAFKSALLVVFAVALARWRRSR